MARTATKKPTVKADLTKPIKVDAIVEVDNTSDCFGKMWDMTCRQCPICSDNILCGIVYKKEAQKIEAARQREKPTLNHAGLDSIRKDKLMMWLSSNTRTTKDMAKLVKEQSNCDDNTSVIMWCQSFIRDNKNISVVNKIIKVGHG